MGAADVLASAATDALAHLEAVEVRRVTMPLRRPHVAAHGSESVREVLVVRAVASDGSEGWGECPTFTSPGYTPECTDTAWDRLCGELAPALLAGRLAGPVAAGVVLDDAFPMASSALEGALVDLGLRRSGVRLADALGATADRVPRCAVLSLPGAAGVDDLVAEVSAAVASGASMVKLKVDPQVGVAHVTAVREVFGDLAVAVDANGSLAGHPALLDDLAALGLVYLEQPLPPGHPDAASVARRLGVPVALDESATGPDALAAALAAGEGSVVNLKAARIGGLAPAVRCWEVATGAGADVFVGGMLETAIGRAGALALAAAVGDGTLPTDLGPSAQYFTTDLGGPVIADGDGRLVVPLGPGSGVVPDPEVLDAVTVARWSQSCR